MGHPAMKALTIRQPHATLIALGVKHIETRSWPTKYRGPLAIHAGKHRPPTDPVGDWIAFPKRAEGNWYTEHFAVGMEVALPGDGQAVLPLGAIVATCELVDCVPITDRRHMPDRGAQLTINPATGTLYLLGSALSGEMINITNQLPYGDFTPGRWAWLLADIVPCEPIPAKGAQGLWTWQP